MLDYFKGKKNLQLLLEFRNDLVQYFRFENNHNSDEYSSISSEVQRKIPKIEQIYRMVGEPDYIFYAPPPIVGGISGNIPLYRNLEKRSEFKIPKTTYLNSLDRVIGKYENILPILKRKLYNPFYWLFERGIFQVIRYLVTMLGFNYERIEGTWKDKAVKLISFIGTIIGIVTGILELIQYSSGK
jgi:hypothetical protein